jgi:hypothetical protein
MDLVNITATDVYSEAETHPYIAIIVVLTVFFILGTIATCAKTTGYGAKVLGWGVYYLLAPVHMPLRWAYSRI